MTRELLPSIIDYAELGEFIDAPLKTYSSGMRARLGFAIATSVDPDILLLDEVLATGDANFRAKSKARVIEIVAAAKAVVLVTHDMNWVTEYCNRAAADRARPAGHGGRAGGRRRAPPRPHRGGPRPRRPRPPRRPAWTRGSSRSADAARPTPRVRRAADRRADVADQRRRRIPRTTPATAPKASAPRQSRRTRTSPSTWRAMTMPANAACAGT